MNNKFIAFGFLMLSAVSTIMLFVSIAYNNINMMGLSWLLLFAVSVPELATCVRILKEDK